MVLYIYIYIGTSFKNVVDGPSSTDSANSHHGNFSLVQNANGIAKKQKENHIEKKINK